MVQGAMLPHPPPPPLDRNVHKIKKGGNIMRKRCSIQQGEKHITVDQIKVLKNRLFWVFLGPPGIISLCKLMNKIKSRFKSVSA